MIVVLEDYTRPFLREKHKHVHYVRLLMYLKPDLSLVVIWRRLKIKFDDKFCLCWKILSFKLRERQLVDAFNRGLKEFTRCAYYMSWQLK